MICQLFIRNGMITRARTILLLLMLCFMTKSALATDDPPLVSVFEGNLNEIAANQEKELIDEKYYDGPWFARIENPANDKYVNTISLLLDENTWSYIPTDFTVSVVIDITWTDKNGVVRTLSNKELEIDYKLAGGTKFNPRNYFIFDNARKVKVKIISVDTGSVTWNVTKILRLENRMQVKRDYIFNCANSVSNVGDVLQYSDELKITWTDDQTNGRTHYDVEWAWVDAEAYDRYKTDDEPDPSLIFKHNASRVTIPAANNFLVPLLYDGSGYLFYRVRPVQYREDGRIVEGTWSTDGESGSIDFYTYSGHETDLNWQVTTTYAEDGKHQTIMKYADGTMRTRQTVTKDNTTKTTIIAETFYDYQGRPTINILPAPTLNNAIAYAKNFNRFVSSDYPKDVYDLVPTGQTICEAETPLMDSTTGAARYYSANNPLSFNMHNYVARSYGYPYSETMYTPDGTGRIAAQGGVGPEFQLNKGHETKYYYGSADQKQLDALFGTEVGERSHYFKNMVRDANGQYSVSYVDMKGRTIATALAGPKPDNLDTIVTYKARYVTTDLLAGNVNQVKDRSIEAATTLLVTKEGPHTFHYELSPLSAEIAACNPPGQPVCYDCYYDLEIRITGTCGEEPIVITRKNFTFGAYDTTCENAPPPFEVDETFTFTEGEYNITKKLTLSKDAQDWYRVNVFNLKNLCKTLQDFYNENYSVMLANSACAIECESCLDSLGTYTQFRTKFLIDQGIANPAITTVPYEQEIQAAYDEAKAACEALCASTPGENKLASIRQMMIEDMTPDQGQYAKLNKDLNEDGDQNDWEIYGDDYYDYETNTNRPFNIFNQTASNPYVTSLDGFPTYRKPKNETTGFDGVYENEFGQTDTEIHRPMSDADNRPLLDVISPEDFSSMFKDSWAKSLLFYHPEYPKLKYAQDNLAASYDWDVQLENTDKWSAATAAGFVPGILSQDPFFNGIGNTEYFSGGTTYHDQMQHYLEDEYVQGRTMWQLAWMSVNCLNEDDPSCGLSMPPQPPYSLSGCAGDSNMVWVVFRSIYMAEKDKMINKLLDEKFNNIIPYQTLADNQYLRRFVSPANFDVFDAINTLQGSDNPGHDGNQYAQGEMAEVFETTCDGYIEMWKQKLLNCEQIANHTEKDAILNAITIGLKSVCIRGSDENHIFGSSTVKPSERNMPPTSFEEVIANVLHQYSLDTTTICHPYMIDYPQPYDAQNPVSNDVVIDPKDTCLCNRLQALTDEKTQAGYGGTLSQFINAQHGVFIRQSLLDSLSLGCSGGLSCALYDPVIEVPAILNCTTPLKTCIDCEEYENLKKVFTDGYPSFTVIHENAEEGTPQMQQNEMFALFMNSRTGLRKTWYDYRQFEIECENYNDPWSCKGLDSIVNLFHQAYGDTLYGASCRTLFVSFFNSAFGTAYTFAQIQALFMEYCGHMPDVCQPEFTCTRFQGVIDSFYVVYGDTIAFAENCQALFVTYFNTRFETNYTWQELEGLFAKLCGGVLNVCNEVDCSRLQAILDSWHDCNRSAFLASNCQEMWTSYFNGIMGTSLQTWQIEALYRRCGIVLDACLPQLDCNTFQHMVDVYYSMGNAACKGSGLDTLSATFCNDCFVWYMNDKLGMSYTFEELAIMFKKSCGKDLQVCKSRLDCKVLTTFTQQFKKWYLLNSGEGPCDSLFTVQFNENFSTSYTFVQILAAYKFYCGAEPAVCEQKAIISCAQLTKVYQQFKALYPDPSKYFRDSCQVAFTKYFNQVFGDTLSYYDISRYYLSVCNMTLNICAPDSCLKLQGFLTKYNALYGGYDMPQQLGRDLFTKLFNDEFATKEKHTRADIEKMYIKCGDTLDIFPADSGYALTCANILVARNAFYVFYGGHLPENCEKAFATFFNTYYGTSFVYAQLVRWASDNCGMALDVCGTPTGPVSLRLRSTATVLPPSMPPRLCGIGDPLFPPVTPEEGDPCDYLVNMALNSATEHYNVYVEQQKDKFDSTYRSKCIETAPPEIFTVRAQVAEYHYTLYYYDQAGNLVRTVPPQGVDISRLEESRIEGWHDSVNLARTAGTHRVPDHSLATNYRYNSLNQVVAQKSPDGGLSKFWYDALGRLVVSQNAKQETTDKYSYTKFDQLGRITEVGQLTSATAIAQNISQDPEDLETWIGSVSNSREQITTTFYDISAGICSPALLCQANLRNRVSYTTLRDLATDADYATASFFSYDIHGNVDTLLNHYFKGVLHDVTGNAFKKMVWKYDLISGKVNELAYQPGYKDEFYHRYNYDAQNRLTTVYTSHDYVYWERQASYEYYKHGPLSRTVLGQLGVQGLDYAYTLQGWLKGVNSTSVTTDYDMGRDAEYTSPIARDAYGFSLNYHANDYIPVRQSQIYLPFASVPFGLTALGDGVQTGRALFNGNIASMTVNIPRLGEAQVYGYSYDQLNRIRAMNAYTGLDTMTNTFTAVTSENYKERVNYDANGNILHYLRNGKEITSTSPLGMDDMVYHYKPGTNQLDHVYDNPSLSSNYPNTPHPTTKDIDDQPLANYEYDEIGNMIKDSTEGISKNGIVWNVYGKIASVTKTEGAVTTIITYTYDPSGNRIGKKVQKTGQTDKYTAYVRDASGNVMAIYEKGNSEINDGQLTQTEISLYGSSRLGVWRPDRDVEGTDWWLFETSAMTGTSNGLRTETWTRGKVNFELSNHLGNVLATITDRKLYDGKFLGRICTLLAGCRDVETDDPYELVELGVNEYPLDNPVFWYPVMKADIVTANDYYPFGMQMPGRTFADENAYRYGFNGKENDNELKRDGNSLDFGARIYDSRLGIFLSTDPREEEYPNQSPYVFAANNPIYLIDVNGEGPGVPPGTVLYANHPYSGAAGILSEGFNAAKYSESGWNWLMTNPDGNSIGKKQANHPVQFKVEVDMSKAKKISHSQWTKWYDEALKELKLSRSATLTEEQVGAATKIRNRIAAEWMTKDGGQLYEITARQGAPTGSGQRIIAARDQVLQNAKPIVVRGSASRLMWESFRRLFTTKVGVKSLGKAGGGILLEIGVLYALEKKHEANRYYAKTQKWSAYNDVGLLYYTPFFDWWDNLKIAPSSVQPDPEAYEKYNKQYGTNFTKAQFNSMRSMAMSAGY